MDKTKIDETKTVRGLAGKKTMWLIFFSIIGASPAIGSLFDTSSYSYASPYILAQIHLSAGYLGLLVSMYALGIAIFSIIGGYLFDKFSAKYTLIIGLIVLSLFTVATGYSVNV